MNENNTALRPENLETFKGQPELTRDLNIILSAAKSRNQVTDHILFAGPPGLGKTTLSQIIAHELGLPLIATSGPAITKPGDIVSILSNMNKSSVVFIDEIHRLDPKAEEMLYSAMEDKKIDFIIGEGKTATTIPLKLQDFVLVGATTQAGMLSAPLRDRFGFIGRLQPYNNEDLAGIVKRSADLWDVNIDEQAALIIASRSRGTPRIANKRLKLVRDWAQFNGKESVDESVALEALESFGVDKIGLDQLGRQILLTIIKSFNGGPVGLNSLAGAVEEAPGTVEGVYEPFLMREGLIAKTARGRIVTAKAYQHLDLPVPDGLVSGSSTQPTLDLE